MKWNRNNIISDNDYFYNETNFNIQGFLNKRGGFLANYRYKDKKNEIEYTASEMIAKVCMFTNISPQLLLVTMQKEQGLISRKTKPTEKKLDWAMGYGCTDSGKIEKYKGFYNQIISAGKRFHDLALKCRLQVGEEVKVGDGIVTPRNVATAALYIYTPWIGDKDAVINGRTWKVPFGNYLFHLVWKGWFGK